MSVKVMGLVWDLEMPPNEKIVLLAYADHADHDGKSIFPAMSKIMKKTGYAERTAQLITRKLVDDGYLVEEGTGKSEFGTNAWYIPITISEGGAKIAPVQRLRGAKKRKKAHKGGANDDIKGVQPVAPEPSFKPSIKKEPSVKAAAKQPPPADPPSPAKLPTEQQAMFQAFADVTLMDPAVKANAARIGRTASGLVKGGYTPAQVVALYSSGGLWYQRDWRGQRGDPPTPEQVGETIKKLMDPTFQDARSNGYHKQTAFERNMAGLAELARQEGFNEP